MRRAGDSGISICVLFSRLGLKPRFRLRAVSDGSRPSRLNGILAALLFLVVGCHQNVQSNRQAYFGPTEPINSVIAQINANNSKIPTLWARHYFEGTIVDEKKQSHFVNADGVLLYRAPLDLRLNAKKPEVTIFDLGSNGQQYWMSVPEQIHTFWWGNYVNLGKPCNEAMPVRPDYIIDVLGITPINPDLTHSPAPVMKFNNDFDAYMIDFVDRLADRYLVRKEVWYDRTSKRPFLAILFDNNGRVVLRAKLLNHKLVPVPDLSKDQWPTMATSFRLFFPDSGTTMSFDLSDLALSHSIGIGPPAPNVNSFRMPDPGDMKVIQIDANCAP